MENNTSALLDHNFFHSLWLNLNPHPTSHAVTLQMVSHCKLTRGSGSGGCVSVPEDRSSNEREKAESHMQSLFSLNSTATSLMFLMSWMKRKRGEARKYFPSIYKKADYPGMIDKVGILGEEMIFNVILRK